VPRQIFIYYVVQDAVKAAERPVWSDVFNHLSCAARVPLSLFVFGRLRAGAYGQSIASCSEMRETTVATLSPFFRWRTSQCPVDRKLSFTESGHTPSDGQPFSLHRPFNRSPVPIELIPPKIAVVMETVRSINWRKRFVDLSLSPLFLVAKRSECCKSARSRLLTTQLSPIKRCWPKKLPSINTMTRPEEPEMRRRGKSG
jgi:hypothetical protein